MAHPFWKIMRDLIYRDQAIDYSQECSRYWKASSRVFHISGGTQKQIFSTCHTDPTRVAEVETVAQRVKDIMFKEFLDTYEVRTEDLPYVRVSAFADYLNSDDGKEEFGVLSRLMRKELH